MADGGIGEAALLSAAIGGGMSAVQGRDPLQGALMGGLLGGLGGAAGFGGAGDIGLEATDMSLGQAGTQNAFANSLGSQEMIPTLTNAGAGAVGSQAASTGLQNSIYGDLGAGTGASSGLPFSTGPTGGISNLPGADGSLASKGINIADASGNAPTSSFTTASQQQSLNNSVGPKMIGADLEQLPSNIPAYSALNAPINPSTPSLLDKAAGLLPETTAGKAMLGGGLGLAYLMNQERNKYGVPAAEKYTGPLSKFSYNPNTYQPDIVRPPSPLYHAQYAAGGPVENMSNNAAIGANTMYPMANMTTSAFATPYQDPRSTNMMSSMAPSGGGTVDQMSGEPNMQGTRLASGGSVRHYDIGGEISGAFNSIGNGIGSALGGVNNLITNAGQGQLSLADQPGTMSMDDPRFKARMEAMLQGKPVPQYASGGISSLGSYSDGGRMLKGPGDGMSDSIPAKIGGRQEARLADGEFVVPADVVSHLGNGSTDAGAKQLYSMMDKVRQARTGRKSQGRQIKPNKYMPA
jgi:hypothetical protein